jgi:hypothetical protein
MKERDLSLFWRSHRLAGEAGKGPEKKYDQADGTWFTPLVKRSGSAKADRGTNAEGLGIL